MKAMRSEGKEQRGRNVCEPPITRPVLSIIDSVDSLTAKDKTCANGCETSFRALKVECKKDG